MAQQVEWPAIPGTEPSQYQSVVNSLLGHIVREAPDDKALRRYMRSRSIFDKASATQLFDLLGIVYQRGQPTQLGPFGKVLFDTDDPVEWQKALFREVARRNEILCKYVFDSLAERLYSVNEMYRGVTSYAYPGKVITLVNFRNWFGWIEATGMIKYIGIRWGPSGQAKEVEDYLRSIDIEELLEEEEEEEAYETEVEAAPAAAAPAAPAAPTPSPAADEVVDSSLADAPDMPPEPPAPEIDAEELPDLPPEPPAPAGAPAQPAAAAPQKPPAAAPAPTSAPQAEAVAATTTPMPTYKSVLTLRSVAEIQEVQKVLQLDPQAPEVMLKAAVVDEAEIARNLEGLRDQWGTPHGKDILSLLSFKIAPRDYKKRSKKPVKSFFVYRALVAATCAFRRVLSNGAGIGPTQSPVNRFIVLDESGALSRHFEEGQPLDEVIGALVASGHGSRPDILALLPYLSLARQALDGEDSEEWLTTLEKSSDAETIWEEVYQRLHAGVFTIELIWVVREMARHELWKCGDLKQTLAVPTQEALDIAFRLGMVPTPYVGSFAAALQASRIVTGFMGEEHGLEAGLIHFAEKLQCSYGCLQTAQCPYFCREKLRR